MSTKTIYKRIALVAVATLGAGLLSVAPASAVSGAYTVTATATAIGAKTGATTAPYSAGDTLVQTITVGTNGATANAETVAFSTTVLAGATGAEKDITSTCTFTATQVVGAAASATGAATVAVTSSGTYTVSPTAASAGAAALAIGSVSCPTTIGGLYKTSFTELAAPTKVGFAAKTDVMAPTAAGVNVAGINVVQGTTRNTTAGTAPTNGLATVSLIVPQHTATTSITLRTSGVGSIQGVGAIVGGGSVKAVNGSTTDFATGVVLTTANDNVLASIPVTLASSVAGVQDITVTSVDATSGIATTIFTGSITWGAAPTLSVALSTAFIGVGNLATVTADATVVSPNTAQAAVANAAATIEVITRDSAGASLLATQTITATVSGPGTLSIAATNTGTSQGRAITGSASMDIISVYGDGTSGTSTITISQGTTVIATKTVTFYGTVATLTAVQNHRIASTAGAALGDGSAAPAATSIVTTPAVVLTAKDANGNAVPGLTITAVSSDTTVMSTGITFAGVTATPGNYNVAVNSVAKASGSTATLTFRVMSGTTVLAATAPLTYTLGGAVASVALSLDAASYEAGAPAVATITVKDSAGNAAFDADHAAILTGALASSLSVTKTLQFNAAANTAVSSLGGVSTVSFNAPGTSAAAWTISGKTGTGPSAAAEKGKALSASASVSNASADAATDAANEATDAANAATDAALAAADAADAATAAAQDAADAVAALSTRVSTLVSNLRKQITALTKLVQRLL